MSIFRFEKLRPRRWLTVIVLFLTAPAAAQVTVIEDDQNNVTTYRMTVSPATQPEPAFKYRLLMHENDRKRGNAAPYYYRAQIDLDRVSKAVRKKFGEEYDTWYNQDLPLAEIPKDKAHEALRYFDGSIMKGLREATSREFCDWGWELQEVHGPEVFQFLLPEVQESRELARMLALRTRLALAEGRLDDAIEFTQMNYQLGRDVNEPPFLVCGLVGVAISGIANNQLLELIAAPDAPNLYWALAELPKPLVDLKPATRFELGSGPRVFPLLQDAETTGRSPQEWSRYVGETWLTMLNNLGGTTPPLPDELPESLRGPEWKAIFPRLLGTGIGLWGYTRAKLALISSGMPAEEVEAMPVGRVIALQASRAYRHTANEMEKQWYMPYPEMRRREGAITESLRSEGYFETSMGSQEIIPIASLLMPATSAARAAQERLMRDIAALQVIEALRMHAAETGKFPSALEDVTIVPVPKNPATQLPFIYHTINLGRTASLELPTTDGFHQGKRFEITLRD